MGGGGESSTSDRRPLVPRSLPSTPALPQQPARGSLQSRPRSLVPTPLRPRPAPPSPHSSGQTRPPQPELQEPPPCTGARPLGAAPPRGLHRPPCRTRPDRGSTPGAASAPRPRPSAGHVCAPGLSAQVGAGRAEARSGNRTPGAGKGGGVQDLGEALRWVSLGGFKQFGTSWAVRGCGALGAKLRLQSWGASWAKLESCSKACFARVRISLEGWFLALLHVRAPRSWPGGPRPTPPSAWGGGSARCSGPIPCLQEKFPRSLPRPLGPSGRPCLCPSPYPTPPPRTPCPRPSRPHPILYHSPLPRLLLAAPQPPSSCPTLALSLRAPHPENSLLPLELGSLKVCSAPPSGTGGSGGGGHN